MSRKPVLGLGIALVALALVLAATATGSPAAQPVIQGCAKSSLPLVTPGQLTLATDNPARRPWWNGAPTHAPWKVSNPYSTKGYESAVAYAVAQRLGFSGREVSWMPMSVEQALARGEKPFDFYLGQVTYGSVRDRAVDFSYGYYLLPIAFLSRRGNPWSGARSLATVKTAFLGVVYGSPAHRYVVRFVPSVGTVAYDSYDSALASLAYDKIGGVVVDLPTAYKLRNRVPGGGVIVGQFPRKGDSQRYALVFEQGSKLRACVNKALAQLWSNGTIEKLQARWLTPAGGGRILR
jgi:polar amino acid transport system substrate-binding protein